MCGECEEKETFDVMINVRPCAITRQGHSYIYIYMVTLIYLIYRVTLMYLANHVKFVYGKKSCLCVRHLWFVQKLKC